MQSDETLPKPDTGGTVQLGVGVSEDMLSVVLTVETTGEHEYKIQIRYDLDETRELCMGLLKAGNAIEAAKKGKISLPPGVVMHPGGHLDRKPMHLR